MVTTLDANPTVAIELPTVLLDSDVLDSDNISPTIMLSNGASVTMQKGERNSWSGTINVAPSAQYEAIVTWSETYADQQLPLARLSQTIQVTAEGEAVVTALTGYSVDLDFDQDGVSNFQERENGTDPFAAPASDAQNLLANDGTVPSNLLVAESTVPQATSGSGSETNPATGTAQAPFAIDLTRSPPELDPIVTSIPTEVVEAAVEAPDTTVGSAPSTTETVSAASTQEATETSTETVPESTPDTAPTATLATTPEATPATITEPTATPQPITEVEPEDTDPAPESLPAVAPSPISIPEATSTVSPDPPPVTAPTPIIESPAVAVIADTIVPRIATSSAPAIDGREVTLGADGMLTGEWAAAVQTDNSGALLLIDNLIIDINAEKPDGTPLRRWAAMHDGTHLYVVVIVDDNGDRQRDSLSTLTNDDSLELFLDGDNSKSTRYGSNDFHRIFPVQLPGADKQSATNGEIDGPNSSSTGLNVTFATGPGIGPRGIRRANFEQDVYELKIKLSSAGIVTNEAFGFELQVNDDVGGGDRDSKWAWKLPSRGLSDVDSTITDPSTMGTLKLE